MNAIKNAIESTKVFFSVVPFIMVALPVALLTIAFILAVKY